MKPEGTMKTNSSRAYKQDPNLMYDYLEILMIHSLGYWDRVHKD